MSIWLVIAAVWALFATCVVLFVRGASARSGRPEDEHNEHTGARAGEPSRVKV
jgi:hypothetical protein